MLAKLIAVQGDQRIVLHKQNAISANAGKILDEVKRKRAGRVKRVVSLEPMYLCGHP
jgi:hypothetical protein